MGWVLETNFASARDLVTHLGFWPDDVLEERVRATAEAHGIPVLTRQEGEEIRRVFEPYLDGFLTRIEAGMKAVKERYLTVSGRTAAVDASSCVDCLVGGLGFHFWLLSAMRRRERECGIWEMRSERQKTVTAYAVDPEAEVLSSRLRVVAGGPTVRLCFITGGAFLENLDVVKRLDHPDVRRSLGTMDRSGEMVISGRGRLLEEAGVVRYRSKGVTGSWRANVPALGWKVVNSVSALVAGMFEEASTALSGCLPELVGRAREDAAFRDSGPGDYLEMSYSVLAALALQRATAEGLMFGRAGKNTGRPGRWGITLLFRREEQGPIGCFILTDAHEIWRDLVLSLYS